MKTPIIVLAGTVAAVAVFALYNSSPASSTSLFMKETTNDYE